MPNHPKKILAGITFRIDRPKGFIKKWPGGKSFTYPCDYGYFPGLTGEDGEGLDAFVGDDPNGHLEVFQKLKPREGGGMDLDETKFLVGVTDSEREKIYNLYRDEIHARRIFKDVEALKNSLTKFKMKKKERYMMKTASHGLQKMVMAYHTYCKEASLKTVLARYKLSDLKKADIDKLIRGNIVAMPNTDRQTDAEEASIEDRLARVFSSADAKTGPTGDESSAGQMPLEGSVSL